MNQQVGGSTAEPTSYQVRNERREHGNEGIPHPRADGCHDDAHVSNDADKFTALDQEPCVHKFGYACKKLLNEHPTFINEVIARAERFQNKSGGETLLDILHGIKRMRIEYMPPCDRERVLRRALRRSNPTLAPVLT